MMVDATVTAHIRLGPRRGEGLIVGTLSIEAIMSDNDVDDAEPDMTMEVVGEEGWVGELPPARRLVSQGHNTDD